MTRNESNVAADAKVEALLLLLLLLILLLVEETEEGEDDEDEDEDDEEIEAREDCPFGSFRCNSPHDDNFEETLSTLRFASRARMISNITSVNATSTNLDGFKATGTTAPELREQLQVRDLC